MAEILTESFCERCGTRYAFETTAPRRRGLGRIRTLSRGVKDFVANDDASFTEAMSAAREDDARRASLQQLDAFQRTFSFCLSCRQYTCQDCWNTSVGECLSCAPDLGREGPPSRLPDLALVGPEDRASAPPDSTRPIIAASAWPTADRRVAREAATIAGPPPLEPIEATQAGEIEATQAGEIEATQAGEIEADLTPEELTAIQDVLSRHAGRSGDAAILAPATGEQPAGVTMDEVPQAPVAAALIVGLTGDVPEPVAGPRVEPRRLLGRFRPGLHRGTPAPTPSAASAALEGAASIEPVVAIEPATSDPVAAGDSQPAAVAAPEPMAPEPTAEEPVAEQPVIAAAPELAAAAPEQEAVAPELAAEMPVAEEFVAEEPEPTLPESAAEKPAEAAPAPPRTDISVQPAWRMVAPDGGSVDETPPTSPFRGTPGTVARPAADTIPTASWAARVATARPLDSGVWAASSRTILAATPPTAAGSAGIQSCTSCGLSLSASARFCRRCGTRQG